MKIAKRKKKVENDPIYSDEQKQLYNDMLENLKIEQQAKPEILL